jgi:type I restriction enzyme S subunit
MRNTGWKKLPFKDAVESHGSGSAGLPQKEWTSVGKFPVIGQGVEDIEGWTDRDDLLLTPHPAVVLYGGHTRRVKHVSHPFVPGPNVKILEPAAGLDSKFLYYFLSQLPIESKGYADHFPLVRKFDVPVPPLAEQQRIVRVLDEALEKIALAKANAEKNLQNARALIDSAAQDVFTQAGEGWVDTCLGDVLSVLRNGLNCKQDKSGKGTRVSRIESIWNGEFDIDRVGFADVTTSEKEKFLLRKGDVLFSHINSAIHVGKTALFNETEEILHGVNLLLMRGNPQISAEFLNLYLKFLFKKGYWRNVCKQSVNQASVNQQDINRAPIRFPKIEAQCVIVDQITHLGKELQRLEQVYAKKLTALQNLKTAMFRQAFAGSLRAA